MRRAAPDCSARTFSAQGSISTSKFAAVPARTSAARRRRSSIRSRAIAAGVFVRPDELDIPLTFDGVRAAKATLGSGVIMLFDDTIDMKAIVLRIAAFFRDESCGQCVPCRVGTVRQEEALHRIVRGKMRGSIDDELRLLGEIDRVMTDASICGLGQTAAGAVRSAVARLGLFQGATP